ncbi:FxsA family protein [Maridesulfovibrio frigidus]|uniref:FxsA family protein n=1 Tax=Maridesulfovibrio frigidus TaxID=340956 RepID=UPI0004E11ACF|nr:FxsA family protein [Maridesulfovibrio frigidus]
MFGKIFLAFVVIPIFDLYLLVKIGGEIGTLNTVMLVLLTAFIGASLARSQGMSTMQKVRENMDRGVMPAEEILDAVIIFAAGLVLLTPGFITDALGLLLLFPPTRGYFKRWLRVQIEQMKKNPNVHMTYQQTEFKAWTNQEQPSQRLDNVIDIEASETKSNEAKNDDKDTPIQ